MLYYKRHIGDYIRDTAHLSLLEHGAYSRLLDVYYIREAPFSEAEAIRLVGARGRDEIAAVKSVLAEFWTTTPEGFRQRRCDHEIAEAHEQAERNRENGKLGGRPPKNKTQSVSKNNPVGFGDGRKKENSSEKLTDNGLGNHFSSPGSEFGKSNINSSENKQLRNPVGFERVNSGNPDETLSNDPIIQLSNLNPPTPLAGGLPGAVAPPGRRSREARNQSLAVWKRALAAIDRINGSNLTWQAVTDELADPICAKAIERTGGHRLIADRTKFNTSELESRFREAYEQGLESSSESEKQRVSEASG